MGMSDAQRSVLEICESNLGCRYIGPDTVAGARRFLMEAVPLSKQVTAARRNGPVTEKQMNFLGNFKLYVGEEYTGPMTFGDVHDFTKKNWNRAIEAIAAKWESLQQERVSVRSIVDGRHYSIDRSIMILEEMANCNWQDDWWPDYEDGTEDLEDDNKFRIGGTPDIDSLSMDVALWSLFL